MIETMHTTENMEMMHTTNIHFCLNIFMSKSAEAADSDRKYCSLNTVFVAGVRSLVTATSMTLVQIMGLKQSKLIFDSLIFKLN